MVSLHQWLTIGRTSAVRQKRSGGGMKKMNKYALLILSWLCGSRWGQRLLIFFSKTGREEIGNHFLCQHQAESVEEQSQGLLQIFSKPSAFTTCYCLFTNTRSYLELVLKIFRYKTKYISSEVPSWYVCSSPGDLEKYLLSVGGENSHFQHKMLSDVVHTVGRTDVGYQLIWNGLYDSILFKNNLKYNFWGWSLVTQAVLSKTSIACSDISYFIASSFMLWEYHRLGTASRFSLVTELNVSALKSLSSSLDEKKKIWRNCLCRSLPRHSDPHTVTFLNWMWWNCTFRHPLLHIYAVSLLYFWCCRICLCFWQDLCICKRRTLIAT